MGSFTASDGTRIAYKDWGEGPPVVFSHGWPLSGDAWDDQLMFLAHRGYRAIAHDRRGHGRSDQPSGGNVMDRYADDLAELIEALDLRGAVLVGHSTGGGEVTRYAGRHGTALLAGLVLISAIPPLMLQTDANPDGVPMAVFDDIRAGVAADRSQFYRDLAAPFFGANRPGATVSQGIRDDFWRQSMLCGLKAAYECVQVFSETDLTEDLRRIAVPVLIVHGDDDQIVPISNSAEKAVRLVADGELLVYEGGSHGLPITAKDRLNADLLRFIRRVHGDAAAPASEAAA